MIVPITDEMIKAAEETAKKRVAGGVTTEYGRMATVQTRTPEEQYRHALLGALGESAAAKATRSIWTKEVMQRITHKPDLCVIKDGKEEACEVHAHWGLICRVRPHSPSGKGYRDMEGGLMVYACNVSEKNNKITLKREAMVLWGVGKKITTWVMEEAHKHPGWKETQPGAECWNPTANDLLKAGLLSEDFSCFGKRG